ncbi:MAG: PGPGW domain-containing protein [Patescibacteria group bacterium]
MIVWKEWFKKIFYKNSPANKIFGVFLIIIGVVAFVTPLSPGSWLIFIGLGLLGVRLAFWERFKVILKAKCTAPPGKNK